MKTIFRWIKDSTLMTIVVVLLSFAVTSAEWALTYDRVNFYRYLDGFASIFIPMFLPIIIVFCFIVNPIRDALRKHSEKLRDSSSHNAVKLNNVVMLGTSKSGKTTLIACMLRELMHMREKLPDFKAGFQITDCARIEELYNILVKVNNPLSTRDETCEVIDLKYKETDFKVSFYDFPGGWLMSDSNKVSELIKKSSVVIIPIETAFLMEEDGKYKDALNISKIKELIRADLIANSNSTSGKLIILAPVKCEKYTSTERESRIMNEKITAAYRDIIEDINFYTSKAAGDFALVIIPVNTLENSRFDHFVMDDSGHVEAVSYSLDSEFPVESKNANQLVKFSLIFLLRETLKFNAAAHAGNINRLINEIKKDTKIHNQKNDPLFIDILCGREFLTGA